MQNLAQLGVSVDKDGKLSFDKSKLETAFADDPDSVKQFFSDETLGFGAKADAAIESLVGVKNSLLVSRSETLSRQVDDLGKRIDSLNTRLERSREVLINDFYNMELAISKIKANLTSIGQIQNLFSTNSTTSN